MKKSILITGIAGSGKSTVCDKLREKGYKAYGIEDMKGFFTMINKKNGRKFHDYDNGNLKSVKQGNWICNIRKLQQLIGKNKGGIVFYCGTSFNLDELLPLFDKIFLLKANQKVLRQRLSKRQSSDYGCTPDVQKWIFSWKKRWEAYYIKKGAIPINASKNLNKVVDEILKRTEPY